MWKPLLFLAGLVLFIGLATATVHRVVIQTREDGLPFDHWGQTITCPLCREGVATWLETGYDYRCEECGKEFRARKNIETWAVEVDW